jgi:hypothetical protein
LLALQKKIENLTRALMTKAREDGEDGNKHIHSTPADNLAYEADVTDLEFFPEQATHEITQTIPEPERHESLDDQLALHLGLSSHEVQHLLDRYTILMAPNMPFVHLPPNPTATSFTKSPLLLRAIIVVAHFHNTSTQQILMHDLIQQLTTTIFTSADKSLDILQALLILCTWYNPHLFHKTSHATLLHLCMALTTDLALDRDPAACEMAHMAAALESCGIPQPQKVVSDAERRAVLGVFWIASTIFTSFRKTDCPTWSPWLQTCLDVLKGKGELMLAGLVESQRVMHAAMLAPQHSDSAVLQAELDDLSARGDSSNSSSPAACLVQLHRTCARIAIWDSAFASSNLDGVWTCIHALKAYLDTYTSLPVPAYLTLPFTVFAQFAYVFVVMVRATSVQIDGFDGTLLRAFIDFEAVMGEASGRYEEVERLSVNGVAVRNEGFMRWAEKTRWAQVYYGMRAKQDGMRGELWGEDGETGATAGKEVELDGGVWGAAFWDGGGELQGDGFCFGGLESTAI